MYMIVGRTFGKWVLPWISFVFFGLLRMTVFVGQSLDHVFFPKIRSTQISKPIIIVGNPRTGTTFLHRFLVKQDLACGQQLWRMLYPSLTLQLFLKPLIPLLEIISPARHHSTVAHKTGLTAIETDDVSVFFRHLDGFFLYGFFLALAEEDLRDMVDIRVRDTSDRDFSWLRKLWVRNLIANKKDRMVAKLFSLGPRIPAFVKEFPDAKVLYMARDPLNVIPSGMSLVTGVLDMRFGFWNLPKEQRDRYLDRLYGAFVELMTRFHEDYVNDGLTKEHVKIVHFERLMSDFEPLMNEILEFCELESNTAVQDEIRAVAEKQRSYVSKHKYDLAKFNLDPQRIQQDCQFFYDTFLSTPGPKNAP